MGELIDALLQLSRLGRAELCRSRVNLSVIAQSVLEEFSRNEPDRRVDCRIQDELIVHADSRLMRVALENLLGNAWKFTSKVVAKIEFGAEQSNGGAVYFVRDNGAGFNMEFATKLFSPFHRLHASADFPGRALDLRPCTASSTSTGAGFGLSLSLVEAQRFTSRFLLYKLEVGHDGWSVCGELRNTI